MEDLFLLIIKESTGTKHNALRQTAQIAYGKYNIASTYSTFYALVCVCVGRVQQHRNNNSNEITKATCKKAISFHCCCAFSSSFACRARFCCCASCSCCCYCCCCCRVRPLAHPLAFPLFFQQESRQRFVTLPAHTQREREGVHYRSRNCPYTALSALLFYSFFIFWLPLKHFDLSFIRR